MIAFQSNETAPNTVDNQQSLRFTPTVWAKLRFIRDAGPCEVGMLGISSSTDMLLIEDVALLQQECSYISTRFGERAVDDFVREQAELGRRAVQCNRVWLHTHPGDDPLPSDNDEDVFASMFGHTDWSVMFILASNGESYCRIQSPIGPGISHHLSVSVDYTASFAASNHEKWIDEYINNVRVVEPFAPTVRRRSELPNETLHSPNRWQASEWVAS